MRKEFLAVLIIVMAAFVLATTASFAEPKTITAYFEELNKSFLSEPAPEPETVTETGSFTEQVEASLMKRLNYLREYTNTGVLEENDKLRELAREHSQYQASIGSITHSDPKGTISQRVWPVLGERPVAENVAYCERNDDVEEVASCLMSGWVGSSGHYANMTNNTYRYVGIGVYGSNRVYYATQIFAG